MVNGLPTSHSNLVAHWDFDDGTAADSSTNANDGAFVGNALTAGEDIVWPFPVEFRYHTAELSCDAAVPAEGLRFQRTTDLVAGTWQDMTNPVATEGSRRRAFTACPPIDEKTTTSTPSDRNFSDEPSSSLEVRWWRAPLQISRT